MKTKFTKIDKVLKTTSKNYKLDAAVHRYKLIKAWNDIAASFVTEAAEATKAVDFKKGVLSVACLSREIAYQIKVLSSRIIYALNQFLGGSVVFAIQVEC